MRAFRIGETRVEIGRNPIIGETAAIRRVLEQADQLAATSATVLPVGETGTGKELFATRIHAASERRQHLMVRVNCAATPATLIESELFGHEQVPLRMLAPGNWAASKYRIAPRSFSVKSGIRRPRFRSNCCGCSKSGTSSDWAALFERAMILARGPELTIPVPKATSQAVNPSTKLRDVQKTHIRNVLETTGWRIRGTGGAAGRLGLRPTTLETRMAKLGLVRPSAS